VSTQTISPSPQGGVDWRRAEFVLTLLGFVGFVTLPVRITTVYENLPAHPLFLHVPVVMIPLTVLAGLAVAAKPEWHRRYGIALSLFCIGTMSSIFLTMRAGAALRSLLNLQGEAGVLIARHSHDASILALIYVVFTATVIVTFAAHRISGGMPTGLGIVDRILSPTSIVTALRVVLVILAIAATYETFEVGDLGARAVWQQRIQAAQAAQRAGGGGYGGPPPAGAPTP
jgi:hypothetical protein